MNEQSICFIGGGNMARSIIGGLIENGASPALLSASDPSEAARQKLTADFGITTRDDNRQACSNADIIILAVKPQQMQSVVENLADSLQGKLAISIAAGVKSDDIKRWAGTSFSLVRCMPNTPALLQCGATGLYADGTVSADNRRSAADILTATGIVAWVQSEAELDTITALSGSGPAYFFLLIESMINAAVKQGSSRELATRFAIQTALGAAQMAQQGIDTPAQLRENVTSPGGTTEAALNSFQHNDFGTIVETAMEAARLRSEQLGNGSG